MKRQHSNQIITKEIAKSIQQAADKIQQQTNKSSTQIQQTEQKQNKNKAINDTRQSEVKLQAPLQDKTNQGKWFKHHKDFIEVSDDESPAQIVLFI